jgi:hypothetical protein
MSGPYKLDYLNTIEGWLHNLPGKARYTLTHTQLEFLVNAAKVNADLLEAAKEMLGAQIEEDHPNVIVRRVEAMRRLRDSIAAAEKGGVR